MRRPLNDRLNEGQCQAKQRRPEPTQISPTSLAQPQAIGLYVPTPNPQVGTGSNERSPMPRDRARKPLAASGEYQDGSSR